MKWYIDGTLYRSEENGKVGPGSGAIVEFPYEPMYFIINNAIDGYNQPNPSDYPKYLYVDYVRAY